MLNQDFSQQSDLPSPVSWKMAIGKGQSGQAGLPSQCLASPNVEKELAISPIWQRKNPGLMPLVASLPFRGRFLHAAGPWRERRGVETYCSLLPRSPPFDPRLI